jgi:2-dehydropantoate 2-reductase
VGTTLICLLNSINSSTLSNSSKELVQILTHAGIECTWADNPQETIWRKAFINISINVFGALARLINGDLPTVDGMWDMMEKTFREAYLVAEQRHIKLFPAESYLEAVRSILKNAGCNKNSMFQDILAGKPTEIDFLNGRIVQYGKASQIETPYNHLLTVLVKGLEKSLKKTN